MAPLVAKPGKSIFRIIRSIKSKNFELQQTITADIIDKM